MPASSCDNSSSLFFALINIKQDSFELIFVDNGSLLRILF